MEEAVTTPNTCRQSSSRRRIRFGRKKSSRSSNGTERSQQNGSAGKRNSIDLLQIPYEMTLHIFHLLDVVSLCRCAQVCKAWHTLAMDHSMWSNVNLSPFQKIVGLRHGKLLRAIMDRSGGYIKRLNLEGCKTLDDISLHPLFPEMTLLVSLNLRGCSRVGHWALVELSKHCHNLEQLDISDGVMEVAVAFEHLADGCRNLCNVNIAYQTSVTDRALQILLSSLSNLQVLTLTACTGLTNATLENIGKFCPQLTRLSIDNIHEVTDTGISSLVAGCQGLEHLCISYCRQLTDATLNHLAENCPKMRILEAAYCQRFNTRGFCTFFEACKGIQRLDTEACYGVTDEALRSLAHHCLNVRWLELSYCSSITNEGMIHLCHAPLRRTLTHLALDNLPLIDDDIILHFLCFRKLQKIDLFDCAGLSEQAVDFLKTKLPSCDVQSYFAPDGPREAPLPIAGRERARCCVVM